MNDWWDAIGFPSPYGVIYFITRLGKYLQLRKLFPSPYGVIYFITPDYSNPMVQQFMLVSVPLRGYLFHYE